MRTLRPKTGRDGMRELTYPEYVRDRVAQTTYLVDRNANEEPANDGWSYASDIAGDATRVAMSLQATNMVPNDTNGVVDLFMRAFPGAPPP